MWILVDFRMTCRKCCIIGSPCRIETIWFDDMDITYKISCLKCHKLTYYKTKAAIAFEDRE